MKNKEKYLIPMIDFKAQTPRIHIGEHKSDILYEEALLSRNTEADSEYRQNVSAWD